MKLFKKAKKGFTLVELVVVIAVIAILAAVSVGAYFGVTDSANKSACEQEAKAFHTSLMIVANDPSYDNYKNGNETLEGKFDIVNGSIVNTYDLEELTTIFAAITGTEYNFVAAALTDATDYVIIEESTVTFASHTKVATITVATGNVTVA